MSKVKKTPTDLVLRFTLSEIKPQIWREVAIEGSTRLDVVHQIIQSLFMWEDGHLHQFTSQGKVYGNTAFLDEGAIVEEAETDIASLLKKKGDKIVYEYDFGDGWEIEIKFVGEWDTDNSPFQSLPICLSGERAAPPEDCGGIPGYLDLIEAIKNPGSSDSADRLEWLGRPWNPDTFDINAANHILSMDLEGFYYSESQGILDDYSELVIEQLNEKTYSCVNDTFIRLTNEGMDRDTAISAITLAFMRERTITKDADRIDENQYSKILGELPRMPWLENEME